MLRVRFANGGEKRKNSRIFAKNTESRRSELIFRGKGDKMIKR